MSVLYYGKYAAPHFQMQKFFQVLCSKWSTNTFFSKVDKRFFGHRRTLFMKLLHKRRRTLFLAS